MGIFGQHAPDYVAAGLPVFPVDTRHKKPKVRNWQRAGRKAAAAWINRFADAEGLGLCMGERTGLVEVDVDMVGDAALGAAIDRFGDTPIKIRTASDKGKLWYRYSGEGRIIRVPSDLPIDILGSGFTVAPPSFRSDLGAGYRFLTGGLDDLAKLPTIRPDSLSSSISHRAAETIRQGERNRSLFMWCMVEARQCDDLETLVDAAMTWSSAMPDPLEYAEIKRTAASAWRYESEGRNYVGLKRPQTCREDMLMDDLSDSPDAFYLLHQFRRYHSGRQYFAISPGAMAANRTVPWCRARIAKARDVLIERGYLGVRRAPDAGRRQSGLYFLTRSDRGGSENLNGSDKWIFCSQAA